MNGFRLDRLAGMRSRFFGCARPLFALVVALWTSVCGAQFGNPRFSFDEEYLAFDYCTPKCMFVVHSLKTGTAITFDAPKGETWINPSFGPKHDQIFFVVIREPSNTQIATIAMDGTGYRELTTSPVIKQSPSVSPNGTRVIFAGSSKTVTDRGSFSSVDLYVTEMGTRAERRVTDLRVQNIGSPFFLRDGERITFATVGSAIRRSAPTVDLEGLYPKRTVFVQSLNELFDLNPVLRVPLVASKPMPLENDEIAVLIRVNEIDGLKQWEFVYDIFLAKDGEATRLTRFQAYVWSYGVSRSGERVSFVTDSPSKNRKNNRLMLWQRSTGKAVELRVPPPERIPLRNH